jgi:REP element-mobilizing transposase RayT
VGRRLRYIPEGSLVEVTCRTVQGRFLLKPTCGFREIVIGLLARAQERYPLRIHAFAVLSNHLHLLVSPENAEQLARFMCHFATNLSKEAGRKHQWRGPLLERRYQAIVVSDEEAAQIERLAYVLGHGVKEDLVQRVCDWPGAHAAQALLHGKPPEGIWFDRTREYTARQRGENRPESDFATTYQLDLAPMPCWKHLRPEQHRQRVADLVQQIDHHATTRRTDSGRSVLGTQGILQQHPHGRPRSIAWSPAPLIHAASKKARLAFRDAYAAFSLGFRAAAAKLSAGATDALFPDGAFPPHLPFVRAGP